MTVQKRKEFQRYIPMNLNASQISVYDVPFAGLGLSEMSKLIMTGGGEGGERGVAHVP